MNESRWLSVKEIAQYLGVKKDTIYKWVTAENIPSHKVGRLWKFKIDEVDEWIRSGGADVRAKKKKQTNKK